MVRDRGCVFPGCRHTRFLHCHHIEHWLHGGETRVENLVMLCSFHHHLVHEGGWTIRRNEDDGFRFRPPEGKPLDRNPSPEPVGDGVAWMGECAQERGLDLGPEVNEPLWDGSKPDYGLAIECLLENP